MLGKESKKLEPSSHMYLEEQVEQYRSSPPQPKWASVYTQSRERSPENNLCLCIAVHGPPEES